MAVTAENELERNHTGQRPSWDCEACGQPWPCANAKDVLLTEFRGYPSVLAIYMSAQMCEAVVDLTAHGTEPPADLFDRFMSWVHLASTDACAGNVFLHGRSPQETWSPEEAGSPQFRPPQFRPQQVRPQQVRPQQVRASQVEALQAEAPRAQTPQAQTPQAQAPQAQAPQAQAPEAQAPQAQTPQVLPPQAQTPQVLPPRAHDDHDRQAADHRGKQR
jgi:hypothetical protein